MMTDDRKSLQTPLGNWRPRTRWWPTALSVVAILMLGTPIGHASGHNGGHVSAYTEWGIGARPVAMGGAYTAVAEGPTGFWWNPAGVAQERHTGIESALRRMSFDRQAGYLAIVLPVGREDAATVAISWIYAGVGNLFERRLDDGGLGAQISDFTNAATFTFARRFSDPLSRVGIAIGLNLRYVQHNIGGISAYSIGFDLGTQIKYELRQRFPDDVESPPELLFGVTVQRLNQKYPWSTSEFWIPRGDESGASFDEKFPLLVRSGTALRFLNGRALAALDIVYEGDQGASLHFGAEGRAHEIFALRAGLDDGDLTFGAGFRPQVRPGLHLNIDYAYAIQPGAIAADHVISLGARF